MENQRPAPRSKEKKPSASAAAMNRKRQKQRPDGGRGEVMDDVLAQLRRQRQGQRSRPPNEGSAGVAAAGVLRGAGPPPDPRARSARRPVEEQVDNFRYDSVRKRYFPKGGDARVRGVEKCDCPGGSNDGQDASSDGQNPFHRGGAVTDGDLRRVVFRGTLLPGRYIDNVERMDGVGNSRRDGADGPRPPPVPCTGRTAFLLAASLEYCASARRREAIASFLGPASVAGSAAITPARSTLEAVRGRTRRCMYSCIDLEERRRDGPVRPHYCAGRDQFRRTDADGSSNLRAPGRPSFSILRSLPPFLALGPLESRIRGRWLQRGPAAPYDCECKSRLQPTAPTFDVLPIPDDRPAPTAPCVATIVNDAAHYRSPRTGGGPCPAWELWRPSESLQYQGLRFAPYRAVDGSPFLGCITHDLRQDEQNFALQKTGTAADTRSREVEVHPLASPVNDFCFTPDSTLQDPGYVAFAHGGNAGVGASFLDIPTGSCVGIRGASSSEPLCLRFRRNNGGNQILLGHRNGRVSVMDTRSGGGALFATSVGTRGLAFGSATSIRPLQNDDNLVAVKGSFGSCRIFDLRLLSNGDGVSSRYKHLKLLELSVSDSLVHQTKSMRCTGLVIDPTECIAISPLACKNGDIQFSMWSVRTGALLRMMNLSSAGEHTISGAGGSNGLPAFCELSSVITPGQEMICKKDSDAPVIRGSPWGLWFKTNLLSDPYAPEGGGIHHIRF